MKLVMTPAAHAALISVVSTEELRYASDRHIKRPDGMIESDIPQDLFEAFAERMLDGETVSDAIIRCVAIMKGMIS